MLDAGHRWTRERNTSRKGILRTFRGQRHEGAAILRPRKSQISALPFTQERTREPNRSALSVSDWELTETYSPAAIDIAPATKPAIPATRTLPRLDSAAATPTIKLAVETIPSLAPRTAARSQPMRCVRWFSGCLIMNSLAPRNGNACEPSERIGWALNVRGVVCGKSGVGSVRISLGCQWSIRAEKFACVVEGKRCAGCRAADAEESGKRETLRRGTDRSEVARRHMLVPSCLRMRSVS
jgi:hypothetical protein